MNLIFKKASAPDAPVIAQLADKIWKKHYPSIITNEQIEYMLERMYSERSIQQQMNDNDEFTIVYDADKPVGYASTSRKAETFFLHKFYIDTEKHRSGIGEKLFDHLLTTMSDAGCIELTVNRKNYKAINFYFKMGFSIVRVVDFDIGNGYFMNDFVMLKKF